MDQRLRRATSVQHVGPLTGTAPPLREGGMGSGNLRRGSGRVFVVGNFRGVAAWFVRRLTLVLSISGFAMMERVFFASP
jgi:hypothetical protein